ncbi:MAG: hypothetical protein R3C41_05510 [Calditrichia bacterium]|nr:hypothetical protein [Calditrichota bacterium]MCB9069879.1 hypothetical protein [Calditrichia bacterium]
MREQLSIFDLMQDDLRKLYDERAAIQQQIDEALSSDDQKTFEQCKKQLDDVQKKINGIQLRTRSKGAK